MGYYPEDHEVIDRLQREIGQTNRDKGFRDDWELAAWLDEFATPSPEHGALAQDIQDKLHACARALRINVLGMKIALCHSELSEMLSDLRDGGDDATLAGEGVDEIIRVLDLLDMHGESAGQPLVEKMRENRGRPFKHGRQA